MIIKEDITQKVKDSFKGLVFEEEAHTYAYKGNSFTSVSNLITNFTEPFERDKISKKVACKRGISQEQVKKEWEVIRDNACNLGRRVHEFAERFASHRYNIEIETYYHDVYQHLAEGEGLLPQEEAVIKFWIEKPAYYVPICLELRMFSQQWGYAGTADIILLDMRDMSLVIADYKTNKDLFKNFKGKTLTGNFSDMKDHPYNKYQLQLSLYEILLRKTGLKISRRFIVWLKRDGSYYIYNTEDLTERLIRSLHENNTYANW